MLWGNSDLPYQPHFNPGFRYCMDITGEYNRAETWRFWKGKMNGFFFLFTEECSLNVQELIENIIFTDMVWKAYRAFN